MSFAVGAKVEHRTFGAGEVAFGPFDHSTGPNHYLIKQEGGKHALVVEDGLSPAAKFKVGDKVTQYGSNYTIHAGPFQGNSVWYAVENASGKVLQANADSLTAVEDKSVKVGDVIRILKDGAFAASVKAGDLFEVKSLHARIPGRIVVDAGPGARMVRWNFRPQDFEKVSADVAAVHDGVVYDLNATYQDADGDPWKLRRDPADSTKVQAQMTPISSYSWDGYDLADAVRRYGPLRKLDV